MWYAVDRFEGDRAVLEDDEGHRRMADRDQLPPDTLQGDVLVLEAGKYLHDRRETQRRRDRIRHLEQRLRGGE